MDPSYKSATELVAALANKDISSSELVEKTISRIEQLDQKINAVVIRDFERARITAKAADKAIARGEHLPLLGLPITVKESFNVVGLSTTWGNPLYKNWCPENDALAVTRLKEAGAIIIGKTNVPYMLKDWQTYNEIYGTTNNPWDLNRTPGGSSGGAAAALAAGFIALELGSDFAGSIRVPAHFCGVFSHKPSVNLIPMRGAGAPTTAPTPNPIVDLLVAGPMARSANDLVLAMKVLAGPDEMWDAKGYKLVLPSARHQEIKNFRVLVVDTHPLCPTSVATTKVIAKLVAQLTRLGVTVSNDTQQYMPDLAEITRTYIALFSAFTAANMPLDEYQKLNARVKTLPADDLSIATCYMRGSVSTHRDWLTKSRIRDQLRQQWRNIFKEFDVVICPVMPTPAFSHDHSDPKHRQIEIDGGLYPYSDQYIWSSIATLFGSPATVVPMSHSENSLPIGIQVIGDYLEDYTTIKFAHLLEQEVGGFSAPHL